MPDANNKTLPTGASVRDFLHGVEPATRRAEGLQVCDLLGRSSGTEPAMWGEAIVGFGSYRYRYNSGRTGIAPRLAFSPRKAQITIYLVPGFDRQSDLLEQLGSHTLGRSCLYIKKMADIDLGILEKVLRRSWAEMAQLFPDDGAL